MAMDLPDEIPIFPLGGALLLPRGILPLNIFEPRYLAMVDHALSTHRLIGMIQPREIGSAELYDTGCAGRIVSFEETDDGRYLINLKGVSRFNIKKETDGKEGFRNIQANWAVFENDLLPTDCLDIDREQLTNLLQTYFEQQGLSCDWEAVKEAPDDRLMTCLAMVCPFEPQEKQALLEARGCTARAELFITMLDMAVKSCECGAEMKH